MIVVSFFTRPLLPKDEYTSEGVYLRLSLDHLRVTTRLIFRTCFAKQTGSIVMSGQLASCRFRLG
jgi:hypothetical protein